MAAEPHRKEVLTRGQALVEEALVLAAVVGVLVLIGRFAGLWTARMADGAARAALVSGFFF